VEAELLLSYVAEMGMPAGPEGDAKADEQVKAAILAARLAHDGGGMTEPVARNLLGADCSNPQNQVLARRDLKHRRDFATQPVLAILVGRQLNHPWRDRADLGDGK